MKAMALMAPTLMEAKAFQSQCPQGSHCLPRHEMKGGGGRTGRVKSDGIFSFLASWEIAKCFSVAN